MDKKTTTRLPEATTPAIAGCSDVTRTQIRNATIEEVAKAVERFSFPFGHSTVDSFAVFIRSLKEC